ncbi:hypothetical protein, partial [Acetobacter sp.]|uniref:hypothetical protein n=1 Tax=Acetobacter sp. TaxID=440 RepID=UPI0039EBB2A7
VEGKPVVALRSDGMFAQVDYNADGRHGIYAVRSAQLVPVPFARLDEARGAGTIAYCADCYSSLAGPADRGLLVTWNGRRWVDGIGKAVAH